MTPLDVPSPLSPAVREAVDFLKSLWEVEPEWCVDTPTGFDWWPGAFRMSVRATSLPPRGGEPVARFTVTTDFLRGIEDGERFAEFVAALNGLAMLEALVLDPEAGTLAFASSVLAPEKELASMMPLLSFAAATHPALAAGIGDTVAGEMGGKGNASAPPGKGERTEPATSLESAAAHLATGTSPRPVPPGEPERIVEQLRGQVAGIFATAGPTGFAVELPWDEGTTCLLLAGGDEPHPRFGPGLLFRLFLPPVGPAREMAREAAALGRAELAGEVDAPLLGGWCTAPAGGGGSEGEPEKARLVFCAFLPEALRIPGSAEFLTGSLILRARAAAERLRPGAPRRDAAEIVAARLAKAGNGPADDDGAQA